MKYDLPEIDETALEAEAQRLWSQACGYQARLDLAEQLAHAAVEHAEAARFDEAARCGQIAKRLYTRMSNLNGLPDVGRIQYWLAAISTEVGWGVSLRRQGDCEGALAVSSTVEDALSVVREEAIQLDDADTLNEWVRTTSAHFMNKGVLLRDLGRKEEAIEAWTAANELLFDIYIRDIGPDEDVESTARVVNIWENKIVLTCEIEQWEVATAELQKAMKLMMWWWSKDTPAPEVVGNAWGDLHGALRALDMDSQKKLREHMPPAGAAALFDD